MQSELVAPPLPCCAKFNLPLHGKLTVVLADADQAFEAVSAADVGPQWCTLAEERAKMFSSEMILVRKGNTDIAKVTRGSYGNGWWMLTLPQLHPALVVFTMATFVTVVGRVYLLQGICIGGVLSSAAVAVALGAHQFSWFRLGGYRRLQYPIDPWGPKACITWRRYVDDLIGCSRMLCARCVLLWMQGAFKVKLSRVGLSSECDGVREAAFRVGVGLILRSGSTGRVCGCFPKMPTGSGCKVADRAPKSPWSRGPCAPLELSGTARRPSLGGSFEGASWD